MRRFLMLGLLIVLSGLLVVGQFYPRIQSVSVTGNRHYAPQDVLALAKLKPGIPFFRITKARLDGLARDPWIRSATVTRHWPNRVSVQVQEREPALTDGAAVYALDGTVLPEPDEAQTQTLIQVSGWGTNRLDEGLVLLNHLAEFEPKVLSYSPAGFTIQLAQTQLFTPSAELLQDNWSSFLSQQGTRVSVYPWGVSTLHD